MIAGACILATRGGRGTYMADLGKAILGLGVVLVVIGGSLMLAGRMGLPLGRLPGDFAWRGKNVQVFFPLGTSILISVVLTLVFYLIFRMRR
jgi:hypothetical protein